MDEDIAFKVIIEQLTPNEWVDRGILDEDDAFFSTIDEVYLVKTKETVEQFGGIHFYKIKEDGFPPYFYCCALIDSYKTGPVTVKTFFEMVAWICEWSVKGED